MPFKQSFSLKEVVVTATIGFLLSGVGGALLSEYLSRAKPSVAITAAAFEGPSQPIETSEALRSAAERAHAFSLAKYVSYTELTDHESDVSERLARTKEALDLTTSWLAAGKLRLSADVWKDVLRGVGEDPLFCK